VPPQGLGGRGLVLTCVKCNSNSGTSFDGHAVRRLDAEDFARGRVNGRVLPATSYVDGIPLRVTAQWTEGGLQLFGVPKQNDPKVQAAHFQALDTYAESGNPNPNVSLPSTHASMRHAPGCRGSGRHTWRPSLPWGGAISSAR
jgi:hypothetical protein